MVAQQIRLLLHLEFWLRHQALVRFTAAPDQEARVEGLDEVIQLSEQLSEVGSVLSSVFSADLDGMLAAPRRLPAVGRGRVAGSSVGRANTVRHQSVRRCRTGSHHTCLAISEVSIACSAELSETKQDRQNVLSEP